MSEFDDIRPYEDHEVADVLARLFEDEEFNRIASDIMMPGALQGSVVGGLLTKMLVRLQMRGFKTIKQCQLLMAEYFEKLIAATMEDLTIEGLDQLSPSQSYLFISNHRDIVLDSSSLNYLLHEANHETSRIAVGDNLFTNQVAADLMRLNKSFMVERGATGAKAVMKALQKTARYTRSSLEEGASIWIAQREGRAKDGFDRTDPALIKMLSLAHRDDGGLQAMIERSRVVAVSVSYEVDPCARRKAHELYVTATEGQYEKADGEDVDSIIEGVVGQKGRVHLKVHAPLQGEFETPEEVALALDQRIVTGMRVFPTHVEAARRIAAGEGDATIEQVPQADVPVSEQALGIFLQDLEECPVAERQYLLLQYANLIKNKEQIDLVDGAAA